MGETFRGLVTDGPLLVAAAVAALVGLISFATMREVVVLPQPDSPTRPTHSPAPISKPMPSTARRVCAFRILPDGRSLSSSRRPADASP